MEGVWRCDLCRYYILRAAVSLVGVLTNGYSTGQYWSELVGTERVCQLTVISGQFRACVLLAYVEGRWFPPQNLSVLSFFVLTYQILWVPSVCAK